MPKRKQSEKHTTNDYIEQLKQVNCQKKEFIRNNQHRIKYQPVRTAYCIIRNTQSRFELLFKIIESQQKIIAKLQHDVHALYNTELTKNKGDVL